MWCGELTTATQEVPLGSISFIKITNLSLLQCCCACQRTTSDHILNSNAIITILSRQKLRALLL